MILYMPTYTTIGNYYVFPYNYGYVFLNEESYPIMQIKVRGEVKGVLL